MSTTIDTLLHRAMRDSGEPTERAVVEAGLHLLIQTHAQTGMRELFGKVDWDGDLEEMRQSRIPDAPFA